MTLPDVQGRPSDLGYPLSRVGVTGVSKPVQIKRPGAAELHALHAEFDVFVDLPAKQRGIHMSRNLEAVNQVVDEAVRRPRGGLESIAQDIARLCLDRHPYAQVAEVRARSRFFLERRTPSGARTLEPYGLFAEAVARREGGSRKAIGVDVTGMTACPCAMETTRHLLEQDGATIRDAPSVTHNQRNVTSLELEVQADDQVDARDLVDLVEESMSAPTYELLKRGDEAALVLQAHRNPRFVEDVVREVLARVAKRYGDQLPADTVVTVRSEAKESIHKHNAFAERVTRLGDLGS